MIKSISMVTRVFIAYLMVVIFLAVLPSASSGKGKSEMKYNSDVMSAEFQEVSLKQILEDIKRKKGIWFKANETLLDKRITVHFNGLTLEKGLRRILADFNHVLFFDKNPEPVGIIIFSDKNHDKSSQNRETPFIGKSDIKWTSTEIKQNLLFSEDQNNKYKTNKPKTAEGFLFSRPGKSFGVKANKTDPYRKNLFTPQAESLFEQREGSFSQSPENSTNNILFQQ